MRRPIAPLGISAVQSPLPETADELCGVARALGIPEAGLDTAVYLGEHSTVSQVKALSESGELARARVVHFVSVRTH
jgi:hypothetical protein